MQQAREATPGNQLLPPAPVVLRRPQSSHGVHRPTRDCPTLSARELRRGRRNEVSRTETGLKVPEAPPVRGRRVHETNSRHHRVRGRSPCARLAGGARLAVATKLGRVPRSTLRHPDPGLQRRFAAYESRSTRSFPPAPGRSAGGFGQIPTPPCALVPAQSRESLPRIPREPPASTSNWSEDGAG